MCIIQLAFTLWAVSTFPKCVCTFELQDTIHALIEENMHLQDQLENLTQALQKLKQLLWNHSEETRNEHDPDLQRLRNEWMQHGVAAETRRLLQYVFCEHDLHASASSPRAHPVLLLITLMYLSFFLS